ncbi:histidine phosphatase family protein [Actinomadura hibisca]|uniref:histidine phosphatase family protein n=1 Tax=Actinomadura hibisca TaxID=68565 RepID=UPI00082B6404|nr:histidine phosphatase family protein [Actinomadura hibisca]
MTGARAWLIRHGQSESNAGLPTHGPGAAPLTERGRAEAAGVAAAFGGPPALIVSSDFVRARETALPARRRFPEVPYEEWPVQEFTYLGQLHGPGTTNAQRRPYAEAYWDRSDPHHVAGEDGESFQNLIDRARDLLARLTVVMERGSVAVFTHGLFMRAVAWTLATGITEPGPDDMRAFRRFMDVFRTPNGSVIELRPQGPDLFQVLLGSAGHLVGGDEVPVPGGRPSYAD